MIIEGKIEVQADINSVFNRLNDVYFFASCIEGVSDLVEISPNKYSATLETKIATSYLTRAHPRQLYYYYYYY